MNYQSGYEKSAHLYDLFDSKVNLPFFLKYAQAIGEVLDIGAGTGRIAIPLAEHGIKVTGIEPSPAMRLEFSRKLRGRHDIAARIELVDSDARSFHLNRTFPAAIMSGCWDHFLTDAERLASLRNIRLHLQPAAVLVFDVYLSLMRDQPLTPAGTARVGDREFRRFVGGTVKENQTREVLLVYEEYRDNKLCDRIETRSLVGITSPAQIRELVKQAGFRIQGEFSDFEFAPFKAGAELMIIAAAVATERAATEAN